MYLGAFRFGGNPDDLVRAYRQLMSGFDANTFDLHICAVGTDGITVLDACPSEEVFHGFSTSPEFRDAYRRAGLPDPSIEPLGTVHHALLREPVDG